MSSNSSSIVSSVAPLSETTSLIEDELPTWFIFILMIEAVVTIVANSLLIAAIFKYRRLRRNISNYFIVSLAKDDLLAGLVVIPLGIIHEIEFVNRELSTEFCDFFQASISMQGFTTAWHMSAIAADRYYKITNPVAYRKYLTKWRICFVSFTLDFLAALVSYHYYLIYKATGVPYERHCAFYTPTTYTVISAWTIGLIPLLFMMYWYIKLWRLSKSYRPPMATTDVNMATNGQVVQPAPGRKVTEKAQSKATLLIGFIMIAYWVSVGPSATVFIIYTYFPSVAIDRTPYIYLFPWMSFLNSALNPLIFFLLTKDLRNIVYNKLKKCNNCSLD